MSMSPVVSAAFRQLISMMNLEEALEHIQGQSGLMAYFSSLPWDEKVFKVDTTRAIGAHDASSGNWMARVSKEGPVLTLTPTIDVNRASETISGARFWRRLITAIEREHDAVHLERGRRPAAAIGRHDEPEAHRWDQRHFLKWTRAPAHPARRDERSGATSSARQAYALFYQ